MRRLLARFAAEWNWSDVPRPYIMHVNEGPDWHFICFRLGTRYGPDICWLEINLGQQR